METVIINQIKKQSYTMKESLRALKTSIKIVAIFFIVISHVVQILTCSNIFIINNDYVLNSSQATTNIQKIILVYFRHFGILGNTIFFTASAWFLLESYHFSAKNIFYDY